MLNKTFQVNSHFKVYVCLWWISPGTCSLAGFDCFFLWVLPATGLSWQSKMFSNFSYDLLTFCLALVWVSTISTPIYATGLLFVKCCMLTNKLLGASVKVYWLKILAPVCIHHVWILVPYGMGFLSWHVLAFGFWSDFLCVTWFLDAVAPGYDSACFPDCWYAACMDL